MAYPNAQRKIIGYRSYPSQPLYGRMLKPGLSWQSPGANWICLAGGWDSPPGPRGGGPQGTNLPGKGAGFLFDLQQVRSIVFPGQGVDNCTVWPPSTAVHLLECASSQMANPISSPARILASCFSLRQWFKPEDYNIRWRRSLTFLFRSRFHTPW